MARNRLDILVNLTAKSGRYQKGMNQAIQKANELNRAQAHLTVSSNRFTKTLADGLNKSSTEVVRFNGNMLSLLFFGMELKRVFGGALNAIFEGYKKIIPENSEFNRMTTKLSANWEFFKFQLADALAQSPVFQKFIQFAIGLLQAFQKLPTPFKEAIGWLLVIGTVLGTILFITGVWALGVGSLINVYGALAGTKGILAVVTSMSKVTTAIHVATNAAYAFAVAWGLPIAAFLLLAYLWKKFVDKFAADIGLQVDTWKEYVAVFVGAFVNGIAQLLISLIQIPALVIDIFVNLIKAAFDFGKTIAKIIAAAFDPTKTVKEEWDSFLRDQVERFSNPNNYGLVTGLQKIKDKISQETLAITSETVNANNQPTNNSAGNIVVINGGLQDAVAQGVLSQAQLDAILGTGVYGEQGR